ncbi:hypothetical protein [Flavobacterium chilense]|nr:hypothetical protein [Flavobacterium chilense]
MNNKIKTILVCLLLSCKVIYAQVGLVINNPHKSAALDMTGMNNKGFLLSNVNLVALDNPAPIVNNAPETGLMVYNSNTALPALNGQPGGEGFYYWDGAKWCRLLIPNNISALDNLGNHKATDILHMTNNDIQNINKTSTQTESIAQGTDGLLPKAGYVATSIDTQGNVVWRPAPYSVAKDTIAFYKESTGAATFTTTFPAFAPIPNLDNFTYTATGSGTLMLEAIFYGQIEGLPAQTNAAADCFGRLAVYNNATLVDEMYTNGKLASFATNKFPAKMVLQLLIPVIKGTTYTIRTSSQLGNKNEAGGFVSPVSIGSITTAGGGVVNSYIMGTLLGLAPLPGQFN